MNTRLNIKKLDENIVQKHRGSKQVGFKQLGPGVKTGVHGVHDEKRVWFEVELSTQQCMKSGVAKHLGVAGLKQQNGLVDETNVTLFAKVCCFLIQSGLSKVFLAEDTTRSTYIVNRSPSSAIGFKKPIDMLGFFGWLASIEQGMLEPVKVKCIFLRCREGIVGNKLWRLDDVTSKVVFTGIWVSMRVGNTKKTFIGSGVGTGSMQVLHGFEFEVELLGDHTFEVEPQENVNQGAGLQEVQTQDLMDYHLACDREQHLACELFGYREDSNEAAFEVAAVKKIYAHESLTFNNTVAYEVISKWKAGLKDDMDARSNVYVLNNGCKKCSDDSNGYYWEYTPGMFIHLFLYIDDMVFSCRCKAEIWATKGLLVKAKGNVLGLEIIRDQSGNTLRVSQFRIHNKKLVQTLLKGHSTLLLEDSLSGDCDVEKNVLDIRKRLGVKEKGVNILKSIECKEPDSDGDQFKKTLVKWNEGSELTKEDRESQLYDDFEHFRQKKGETIHDYYVRFTKLTNDMRNIKMTMPRMQLNSKFVNNMLPEWGRFVTTVKLNRGLRDSNYDQLYAYLKQHEAHGRQNRGQGNNARGAGAAGYGGAQNRVGNANPGQARQIKYYNCNGIGHIARNCTQPKRPQNLEYFKDKMLLMQAQENGMALDEEQLLFIAGGQDNAVDEDVDEQLVQDLALNVDNVFQADDCDAFDSDVDEAPTAQTMLMANLSSADPVYDEAGPSYDSDILFEVHDHDYYQDAVCEHHEAHEMHHDVQLNCVVDSNTDYTSDSNMITYDQYVKDNAEPVVQSNVSSVLNDAYMMIINEMHEQSARSVSANKQNKVVNASLTAELATYKEQVELYERRAKFELTEREQKIEEQLE
ncbi:retrovirus-related pol polyprotein from transposon TNT 1-94 [Tanacetum coccineum]